MTSDKPEHIKGTIEDFKPEDHLMNIQGKEYLEVKWRMVWFRQKFPHGSIVTEELEYNPDFPCLKAVYNKVTRQTEMVPAKGCARFKATVTDGEGGRATGHKREDAGGFDDYYEKSETGSIGRALAVLGFGTQFTEESSEVEANRLADSPVDRTPPKESLSILSTVSATPTPAPAPKTAPTPKQAPVQQQQQVQQTTKEEPVLPTSSPSPDVAVLTPAGAMAQIQAFIAVMSPEYIVTLCKRLFEGKQPGELTDSEKVAFAQTLQKRAISFQLERLVDPNFKTFQAGYKGKKQSPLDLITAVGTTLSEAEQGYLNHCTKLIIDKKAGLTEAFVSTHAQFLADIGIDPKHVKLLQAK